MSLLDALGMMCAYNPPRNRLSTTPKVQRQDLSAKLLNDYTRLSLGNTIGDMEAVYRIAKDLVPGSRGFLKGRD